MGKYGMTRAKSSQRKRGGSGAGALNDDAINQLKYLFGEVGAFGIYPIKMYDSWSYMNDYLKNRNMSWSDMKYPSIAPKNPNGGSGFWKASEKAVKRLYK